MSDERELIHRDPARRGRARMLAIGATIGATLIAAGAALVATTLGGTSLAVGAPAAVAALSLTAGVMLVARALVAFRTMAEPRPRAEELPVLVETDRRLRRRLLAPLGIAAGAVLALSLLPLGAIVPRPRRAGAARWGRGVRAVDARGRLVSPKALRPGAVIYPEGAAGHAASIAVLASIDPPRAFSKICTHAGCAVDLDARSGRFVCPCHLSAFSIDDGRRVAGPAGKALPGLPLAVDAEGHLVAAGELEAPPGPTVG